MSLSKTPSPNTSQSVVGNRPGFFSRRKILQTLGLWSFWTGLTAASAHNNANQIQYIHEGIPLRVPEALSGLRMVFLTDPHIGGNIDMLAADISTQLHILLSGWTPQNTLILHGGDWVCCQTHVNNATPRDSMRKVTPVLFRWLEQFVNIGVVGNHDHDHPDFEPYFRQKLEQDHNIHMLHTPEERRYFSYNNETIALHGLHTLGTHMRFLPENERSDILDRTIAELNNGHQVINICLMHNPDGLEYILRQLKLTGRKIEKPTFFLAGHTHGAMFNVPGLRGISLAACSLEFNRFNGVHIPSWEYADTGEWALRISNGMGNSPYRALRLKASPEVICFQL